MRGNPSADAGERKAAACPYCGATNTEQEHGKGPSLCRSIHYCHDCRESFEAMR